MAQDDGGAGPDDLQNFLLTLGSGKCWAIAPSNTSSLATSRLACARVVPGQPTSSQKPTKITSNSRRTTVELSQPGYAESPQQHVARITRVQAVNEVGYQGRTADLRGTACAQVGTYLALWASPEAF